MASIKRRPNGSWRARYRDAAGREHARHFGRKVDAQRWLDEVTATVVTGQYVDPRAGRVTFREFAELWRLSGIHGAPTQERVQRSLRLHVYPAIGDLAMGSIRPSTLQALVTRVSAKLAPSTVRVQWSVVVAIFRTAVRDKVVPSSPCEGVRLPEHRRRKVEPPPLDLVDKLTAALPAEFRAVVALVAGSGLRQGEVFGLEVERLDFLRGRSVEVVQQLVTLPGQPPYLALPKTAESLRTVPLARVTLDQLAAHLAAFPVVEVEIEDRTDPRRPVVRSARLVFTRNNRPIARHDWPAVWVPAARAVGLPSRTGLHVLRHLYASLLIRHGESIKTVQARMGHGSAAITLDTYGHLWPDADDRTREAVEHALGTGADSLRTASGS